MLTLGIESSCDDTSVALLRDGREILSVVSKSQVELHKDFGGVVPEIAARGHLEIAIKVLDEALLQAGVTMSQIDLIAATAGPGLIGSLLVGLNMAKGLCVRYDKPLVAVHHLEAHFAANFLEFAEIEFPMVGLLVSGGHTCLYEIISPGEYKILGETRDDAVGELYDKIAHKLSLGMPGGPIIDKMVVGMRQGVKFNPPMLHSKDLDFSFSGLKTACIQAIKRGEKKEEIAFGMQAAAIEVLWAKTFLALTNTGARTLILAGGVSANRGLRERFSRECEKEGICLYVPPIHLCTDNGAMVAKAGWDRYRLGFESDLDVDVFSRMPLCGINKEKLWAKSR